MSDAPSSNRRIYREIADQLREKILAGEYASGTRLPSERELAEDLEVSRSSVREALIALEIGGYVDVRLGSGVYVRSAIGSAEVIPPVLPLARPVPKGGASRKGKSHAKPAALPALQTEEILPFELLEARLLVEPECAASAALNISDAQIVELKKLHLQMLQTGTWGNDDHIFHTLISDSCGNNALASACRHLWGLTISSDLYQRLNQFIVTPEVWSHNLVEHERIVSALVSRDPIRARHAMQQHLIGIMARLKEANLA